MKNDKIINKDLFLPYYINKERLLDIHAILNNGYDEYQEISTTSQTDTNKKTNVNANANAGFSLISIGGGISREKDNSSSDLNNVTMKKIQTLTSILSSTIFDLTNNNFLTNSIENSKEGDFIEINCTFNMNSIVNVFQELKMLINLFSKLDKNYKNQINMKDLDAILKMFGFNDCIEILYKNDGYAISSFLKEQNLYESTLSDIISNNLSCLCQIKKISPLGSTLLKYNVFSGINSSANKTEFIQAIEGFVNNGVYNFKSNIVFEIKNIPVYDIEIIALYKKNKQSI